MNETGAAAPPPARTLRTARETQGLSLAKVADELRLTPDQVMAMEEGDYDRLGPAVFARGHVRRYAVLLGLPVEGFLESYEATHRGDASPSLVPPASLHTPVTDARDLRTRLLAALVPVALILAVALAWWLQARSPQPAPAGRPAAAEPAAAAQESAAAPVPEQDADAALEPPGARLALEFSDLCWIEVYDATGERLAYELARPDARLEFPGPAPWRVLLGNVAAVRMSVDDRVVPLAGDAVVQNTASLFVDEAGTAARVPTESADGA